MLKAKIQSLLPQLSESEKKIVEYIETQPINVKDLTSTKLAKELEISQSTVIRFTQKLGYENFRGFLADLHLVTANDQDFTQDVTKEESMSISVSRVLTQYLDVINMTHNDNTIDSIEQAASMLHHARKIMLFGRANNDFFCEYFQVQMMRYHMQAFFDRDNHNSFYILSQMNVEDVLIVISESGETFELLQILSAAKRVGVKILAITGKARSSLTSMADHVLYTVTFKQETRITSNVIRVSQLFLIDIIMITLLKLDYDGYLQVVMHGDELFRDEYSKLQGFYDFSHK